MLNNTIQECTCVGQCLGHKYVKMPFKKPVDNLKLLEAALKKHGFKYGKPVHKSDGSISIEVLTNN